MHFNREIIFYFRRGSGLRRIRQNNNPMVVAIDRPLPPTHLFIGRLNHGGTGGPSPPPCEYERRVANTRESIVAAHLHVKKNIGCSLVPLQAK